MYCLQLLIVVYYNFTFVCSLNSINIINFMLCAVSVSYIPINVRIIMYGRKFFFIVYKNYIVYLCLYGQS